MPPSRDQRFRFKTSSNRALRATTRQRPVKVFRVGNLAINQSSWPRKRAVLSASSSFQNTGKTGKKSNSGNRPLRVSVLVIVFSVQCRCRPLWQQLYQCRAVEPGSGRYISAVEVKGAARSGGPLPQNFQIPRRKLKDAYGRPKLSQPLIHVNAGSCQEMAVDAQVKSQAKQLSCA